MDNACKKGSIRDIVIILLFCIFLISIVSRELLNFNRIFSYEMYGYSHLDGKFEKVCDFNNTYRKFKISNNVSPTREDSFFFTSPSKILYDKVNPRVTHRVVCVACYVIFIVSFAALVYLLTRSLLLTLFSLSYIGLFSQFLSYFFQFKLSLTSISLISVTFLFVYLFYDAHRKRKNKFATFYLFILTILLINFGFEAFCISRPVNIIMYFFIFLYLLKCDKKALGYYLLFTVISITLLKLTNPDIRFNMSIFIARGEGITRFERASFVVYSVSEIFSIIKTRLLELPIIFKRPVDDVYRSEVLMYAGNLDILLMLLVILVIYAILFTTINKDKLQNIKCSLKNNLFYIIFFSVIFLFSIIPPLLSTRFIRGHRLLPFYISSYLLFLVLFNSLVNKISYRYRNSVNTLIFIAFLLVSYYKLNIFLKYDFKRHNTDAQTTECLGTIDRLTNITKKIDDVNNIVICDNGKQSLYEPSWNGIMYITGLACKRTSFNNKITLIKRKDKKKCECSRNKGDICLIREDPCKIKLIRYH